MKCTCLCSETLNHSSQTIEIGLIMMFLPFREMQNLWLYMYVALICGVLV